MVWLSWVTKACLKYSQEVRAVERRLLLETLASQLPPETIKFSSKLKTIQSNANGDTQLELEDGSKLLAKVLFLSSKMTRNYMIWLICLMYVFWQIVIGCDGIRSKVATWMGFGEPKYVGHCAFWGLGYYPEGQPFQKKKWTTYTEEGFFNKSLLVHMFQQPISRYTILIFFPFV